LDAAHMNALQQKVEKGLANGYVGLDASGNIALAAAAKVVWAGDTNLYRAAADTLQTDDLFVGQSSSSNDARLATKLTADTGYRWVVRADGNMYWGNGGGVYGTKLCRWAANTLTTDGKIEAGKGLTAGVAALGVFVGADPQYRFTLGNDGKMQWGPGNVGTDTNLYRSGANRLRTDGDFVIGGQLWTGMAGAGATGGGLNWEGGVYRGGASGCLRPAPACSSR